MKYEQAQEELRNAIKNQQSIRTGKLAKLLQDMNISLKKDDRIRKRKFDDEVRRKKNAKF